MDLTDYHAKYIAHGLTRRCPPDSAEKLAGAVAGAQVDLNPHQVGTALRNQKRRSLFDAQDQVDRQREALIAAIEGKLAQWTNLDTIFAVRWSLA